MDPEASGAGSYQLLLLCPLWLRILLSVHIFSKSISCYAFVVWGAGICLGGQDALLWRAIGGLLGCCIWLARSVRVLCLVFETFTC